MVCLGAIDASEIAIIGTAITIIGGAVIGLVWKVFSLGRQIGELEGRASVALNRADRADDKTDALIGFQRRRGMVKAMNRGMIEPRRAYDEDEVYRLTPEWREAVQ